MIKYNFVISLLFLLGTSQVYAQFNNMSDAGHVDVWRVNNTSDFENVKSVAYLGGIAPVGTATVDDYYNKNWESVSITFNTNTIAKYDRARYNLNLKILELQVENKVYFLSSKSINKLVFTASNKTFIAKADEPNLGLLELIAEYKNILFVKTYTIKAAGKAQAYGGIPKPIKTEKKYLFKPNESLFRISSNKKKNAKFFAEDWIEIEKFMKKERLSFKKKDDIIKIMEFYTRLKS